MYPAVISNIFEEECYMKVMDHPWIQDRSFNWNMAFKLHSRWQLKREEEKASGIAPVHTSFDDSMADIIERFREKDAEDQQ